MFRRWGGAVYGIIRNYCKEFGGNGGIEKCAKRNVDKRVGPGYTIYIYPCWWEWLQGTGAVFLKLWFETTQLLRISILHFILRKSALAILDSRTEIIRALNAMFWHYSKLLLLVQKKENNRIFTKGNVSVKFPSIVSVAEIHF